MTMANITTALSPPQPLSGQRVLRISGFSGSATTESAGSGSSSMAPVQRTGKTKRWTHEQNREVMRAYYGSSPTRTGYRKRMLAIWRKDHPGDRITENHLAEQRRAIMARGFLSDEELRLIQNQLSGCTDQTTPVPVEAGADVIQEEAAAEPQQEPRVSDNGGMCAFGKQIMENVVPIDARERLPPLKGKDKAKLTSLIDKANEAIPNIDIPNLTTLNNVLYATALTVTLEMGVKRTRCPPGKDPPWKVRIQRNIEKFQRNLSQVEAWKASKLQNEGVRKRLDDTYGVKQKGFQVVLEELKQRLVAEAAKLQRYNRIHAERRQNRQFCHDQRRLYAELQKEERGEAPNPEQSVQFWTALWSKRVDHRIDAKWMDAVRKATDKVPQQADVEISAEMVREGTRRMKNWKAPGPDEVHAFWLKKLTSLHAPMANLYQRSIAEGCPEWMTTGRTVLLQKDKAKGTAVDNYRPITCLPSMWKLLSKIISDSLQRHLDSNDLIPCEQKGCVLKCRGCKDHLLTDKAVVKNCKRRRTNLEMVWIDFKKAYDRVPHSWIVECMKLFKVNSLVRDFLAKEMHNWKTNLTSGGIHLGRVPIRRGIFQGDSLSPLLFIMAMAPISTVLNRMKKGYEMERGEKQISHLLYMDDFKLYAKTVQGIESMVNTLKTVSEDIGMEFGLDKCARVSMKRGKIVSGGDLPLYDGQCIKELDESTGYKYLGILQSDMTKKAEAIETVRREYFRRLRLTLKSELNAGNTIRAINAWAIPVIRYTGGIVDWTVAELREIDKKTRRLLTLHGAFSMHGDVDRLYVPRCKGGKGLLQVEQLVREEECELTEYVCHHERNDRLLRMVYKERVIQAEETKSQCRQRLAEERLQSWKSKPLHGMFIRQTEDVIDEKESVRWIRDGYMKKGAESLLMAAQEQSLRTRKIRCAIDKADVDPKCRWCGQKDESVEHLISGCSKLAPMEYLARHNKVASIVHWRLCKRYDIQVHKDVHRHQVQPVVETDKVKILWDMFVQTDRVIRARRPDIVVVDKSSKEVTIIDIGVPADKNVLEKESEKVMKYQDLKTEIKRIWNMRRVKVIPVVVGALGCFPKDWQNWLDVLGLTEQDRVALQKAALYGSARIIGKTLAL